LLRFSDTLSAAAAYMRLIRYCCRDEEIYDAAALALLYLRASCAAPPLMFSDIMLSLSFRLRAIFFG